MFKVGNDERTRKLRNNALMMYLYRIGGILVNFLYVPLLIDALSVENYGIWLTLTSIISWLSFFDVGLGNGMRNRVTYSLANNNIHLAKQYVSTTYFIMSVVSIIFIVLSLMIIPNVNWLRILNAPNADSTEMAKLVLCVVTMFFVQLVLKLITSLFNSLQEPAKSASITFYSQALGLIVVFLLNHFIPTDSLLIYGIIISLLPLLVMGGYSLILFNGSLRYLSPSVSDIDLKKCCDVLNVGVQYFFVQITAIFMFQSNSFIIAHCVNVSSVVDYNVTYKYLSIPLMGYTILTAPLWSATTDAFAKGDMNWIVNTIKKMKKIGYAFSLLLVFQLCVSPLVYAIWVGDKLSIDWLLMVLLCIYVGLSLQTALYCSIINGLGKIRMQLIFTLIESFIHIPLAILLAKNIGISGVVISLIILTTINVIWEPIQIDKILKNKAYGIWNK